MSEKRTAKLTCHVEAKVGMPNYSSRTIGYLLELDAEFDEEKKAEQLSKKYSDMRRFLEKLVQQGLSEDPKAEPKKPKPAPKKDVWIDASDPPAV